MYAVTSKPLVKRTRAILRIAELGFLGVAVDTRVHTPRFCGESTFVGNFFNVFKPTPSCGDFDLRTLSCLDLRTIWLFVGIYVSPFINLLNMATFPGVSKSNKI